MIANSAGRARAIPATTHRFATQYRIRRANDQQMRWVQVWCEYETDTAPHHTTRMTGTDVVQDITERKQSEQS